MQPAIFQAASNFPLERGDLYSLAGAACEKWPRPKPQRLRNGEWREKKKKKNPPTLGKVLLSHVKKQIIKTRQRKRKRRGGGVGWWVEGDG